MITYCTKSIKHDKSYLPMIPYYLSLIFFINEAWASLVIFHVPQRIPRGKQTLGTSKNSIFTQIILDHFPTPYFFHLFSKNFCGKYSVITYFASFYYLLFYYYILLFYYCFAALLRKTKNYLDGNRKRAYIYIRIVKDQI